MHWKKGGKVQRYLDEFMFVMDWSSTAVKGMKLVYCRWVKPTHDRPPKRKWSQISTTKKPQASNSSPVCVVCCTWKKSLFFSWKIRVFFSSFFCCPKTSHFFCLFRVRKVWKIKRFYFDSILQVYQHSCYEEDVAYRADFHSAPCYLKISSVVSD